MNANAIENAPPFAVVAREFERRIYVSYQRLAFANRYHRLGYRVRFEDRYTVLTAPDGASTTYII